MGINEAMRAALRAISYKDLDVAKNYQMIREVKTITGRRMLKDPYRTWDHSVCRGGRCVPVRLYGPDACFLTPGVLLFFHGGGWVTGNIDSYDKVCSHMAKKTGQMVVSVDYRLAPEHKFPAGLEDCYAIAKELYTGSMPGVRPEHITLIGDSAGGNLAAAVSLLARDRGEFAVRRQILLYPATTADHGPDAPFPSLRTNGTDYLLTTKRVQDYLALYQSSAEDLTSPYFAPLSAKDLTRQPDTLIITAEYDPLRDEGEAYGEALRAAGAKVRIVRLANALHGFISLPPRFVHVKLAYAQINAFLSGGECR